MNTSLLYHCRMCKKPGVTQHEVGLDPSWIAKLAPMLVCNPCYDRRTRFTECTEVIMTTCWNLAVIRKSGNKAKIFDMEGRAKSILERATLNYAKLLADYRNLVEYVWHLDFVNQLLENAEKASWILKTYRSNLSTMPKREPVQLRDTHPDA